MIPLPDIARTALLRQGGDSSRFGLELLGHGQPAFGLSLTTVKHTTLLEVALSKFGAIDRLVWCQYRLRLNRLQYLSGLRNQGYVRELQVMTSAVGLETPASRETTEYARKALPGAVQCVKTHLKGFAMRFRSGACLTVLTSCETFGSNAEWWMAIPEETAHKWFAALATNQPTIPTLERDDVAAQRILAVGWTRQKNRVDVQNKLSNVPKHELWHITSRFCFVNPRETSSMSFLAAYIHRARCRDVSLMGAWISSLTTEAIKVLESAFGCRFRVAYGHFMSSSRTQSDLEYLHSHFDAKRTVEAPNHAKLALLASDRRSRVLFSSGNWQANQVSQEIFGCLDSAPVVALVMWLNNYFWRPRC